MRALRSLLRGLWFALIPALFSALAMRFLVPHSLTAPGLEGALALAARTHALVFALSLFLGFVLLIRYWRSYLPGGRYLSALPPALVARVPRRRIESCEAAWALLTALEVRSVSLRISTLAPEPRRALESARDELRKLLDTGKWSKVSAAASKLAPLIEPHTKTSELWSNAGFVALLVVSALLALQLRTRFVQAFEVEGTSMLPSLTPGQMLGGSVIAFGPGRLPLRGEVVVLRTLVDGTPQELIKRVIGLPGDHLEMVGVHPVINGWQVPVCDVGAYYSPDDETSRAGDPGSRAVMEFLGGEAYLTLQATVAAPFSEYVVKPGEVFVMGDNRSNSRDSRSFDHGQPHGFPLRELEATIHRVLFSRTPDGAIDPALALQRLSSQISLRGADLSELREHLNACLASRPKSAGPPRPPTTALALHD